MPQTPEERRAYIHAWYRKNKAKQQAYHRAKYQRKKEQIKAQLRVYYYAHQEEMQAKARQQYHANPAKAIARTIRWMKANPHKVKAKEARRRQANPSRATLWTQENWHRIKYRHQELSAAWEKAHPEYGQAKRLKRRARLHTAPLNDLTYEQVQMLLASAHGVCCYCPAYKPGCKACQSGTHKLTVDHITPLSKGGANTLQNLVACCISCNAKKCAKAAPTFVQPLLL